jgi:hypothetical protein
LPQIGDLVVETALTRIPGSPPYARPAATSKVSFKTTNASFGVNAIGQCLRLVRQQWRRLPTISGGDRSAAVDPELTKILLGTGH